MPLANQRINTVNTQLLRLLRHDRFGQVLCLLLAAAGMYSPFFSKLSNGTLPLYDVFADGNAGEADGLALADSDSAISTGGYTVRAHADNTVTRPTPPRTQRGATAQGDGLRSGASHQQSFGEVNGQGGVSRPPHHIRRTLEQP